MSDAAGILANLSAVARERELRAGDPALDAGVRAIKSYQHRRFEKTYADLLADTRYVSAARFFLDELYGPQDFVGRDQQFARVVPALVRLFSSEIVETVADLATLHALSEQLDTCMGYALGMRDVDARRYVDAWQTTGRRSERGKQIDLILRVGHALDRHTRKPGLRRALHLMRAPAALARLSDLQRFLERGFDTFGAMSRPDEFLQTVASRERQLLERLFAASLNGDLRAAGLGELP
jgi:D-alanyl-D-alanine dipeptidase